VLTIPLHPFHPLCYVDEKIEKLYGLFSRGIYVGETEVFHVSSLAKSSEERASSGAVLDISRYNLIYTCSAFPTKLNNSWFGQLIRFGNLLIHDRRTELPLETFYNSVLSSASGGTWKRGGNAISSLLSRVNHDFPPPMIMSIIIHHSSSHQYDISFSR